MMLLAGELLLLGDGETGQIVAGSAAPEGWKEGDPRCESRVLWGRSAGGRGLKLGALSSRGNAGQQSWLRTECK